MSYNTPNLNPLFLSPWDYSSFVTKCSLLKCTSVPPPTYRHYPVVST